MPPLVWQCCDRAIEIGRRPLVMGIVNVTPDSFSACGRFSDTSPAVEPSLKLVADGADILDIGGESSRPRAAPVSLDEELRRVAPVIAELAKQTPVPISIDTTKPEVARRCLEVGASIINDVGGFRDPDLIAAAAEYRVGLVVMHMQGTPATMQTNPHYDDVVREV